MNRFLTLICLFFSFCAFAQNTAVASASSDFKTIRNGKVESTFVMKNDLTVQQAESLNEWITENKLSESLNLTGKTLTAKVPVQFNERNFYSKVFHFLQVDAVEAIVDGQTKTFDTEGFFTHFNL